MPLELANEVWSEVKRYINGVDRSSAAETVVEVLVENGHDAVDIKEAFKGDREIKEALAQYLEPEQEDDEEDYDDYEEDEY